MTTRISTGGPTTGIAAVVSAGRVTAPPGQPFKAMMNAGASAILSGAEQAVTRLPGGPILAAALRSPATPGAGSGATPTGTSTAAGAGAGAAGLGAAEPGGTTSSLEAALSDGASQNLFFIQLQERINAESRDYSAWSNILKARHDTVKNAIGNLR